jgi:methionyl-tRNA formyltransferase
VILAHGGSPGRSRLWKRKLAKIWRIGPLGALNGIRMRDWFVDREAPDIGEVCRRHGVPLLETPFLNCDQTRRLMREANADLGLSLGNGYIAESVYSIPRLGMVNIHSEILPQFQGAQSVIWPIHEGLRETGFTIHRVSRAIDAGDIVFQAKYPIEFRATLRATVEHNLARSRERIPQTFVEVCERFDELAARATPQPRRASFTTPSYWQYRRMERNNGRFFAQGRTGLA